jgi:choline dehydrogenase-like flavoprotein
MNINLVPLKGNSFYLPERMPGRKKHFHCPTWYYQNAMYHQHAMHHPQHQHREDGKTNVLVVGGGTAGAVVAARLAMAGKTVRILEGGPDTTFDSKDPDVQRDKAFIKLPIGVFSLYESYASEQPDPKPPVSCLLNYVGKQIENPGYENPRMYQRYPRAHGAGGCSSHHAMQDGVGDLRIYDKMAKSIGDDFFNGANMGKLFKKMEDGSAIKDQDGTINGVSWPKNLADNFGKDGWLRVQYGTLRELERDFLGEIVGKTDKYGESAQLVDLRSSKVGGAEGLGMTGIQTYKTDTESGPAYSRSYAYQELIETTFLGVQNNNETYRENITVHFNTFVTKLLFDDCKRCIGVECVAQKAYNKAAPLGTRVVPAEGTDGEFKTEFKTDGELSGWVSKASGAQPQYLYFADEIVVCGGFVQSPQLLMLSGIGPAEHLKSHGISVLVDSPGVGSNLTDHQEIICPFELDSTKIMHPWQALFLYGPNGIADGTVPEEYQEAYSKALEDNPDAFGENTGVLAWDAYSSDDYKKGTGYWADKPNGKTRGCGHDIHSTLWMAPFFNFDHDYGRGKFDVAGKPISKPGIIDESATLSAEHYNHNYREVIPSEDDFNKPSESPHTRAEIWNGQFNPQKPRTFTSMLIENMYPTVTGTVRLKSSDPRDEPIIDQKLYEDKEGMRRMAEFFLDKVRPAMDAIRERWGAPVGERYEMQPGIAADTVEKLVEYIKFHSAYGHHGSGTCQMGPHTAAQGDVCDSHFRVNGVTNLRVADTSSYRAPYIHGYNTSRGAYLMGEACAHRMLYPEAKAP